MNERDIDRLIKRAREIADFLDLEDMNLMAADIRRLATSRAQARETNRRLWSDNQDLRRRLQAYRARPTA